MIIPRTKWQIIRVCVQPVDSDLAVGASVNENGFDTWLEDGLDGVVKNRWTNKCMNGTMWMNWIAVKPDGKKGIPAGYNFGTKWNRI